MKKRVTSGAALVRRLRVLALGIALAGCTRAPSAPRPPKYPGAHPPPVTVDPKPAYVLPPAEPLAPDQAPLLDSGELITGSREALEAWQPDGNSHRVISPGAAFHPRRFGHDHVIVLRPIGMDVREGAVIDLIALADGARHELAQLPPFSCAEQTDPGQPKPPGLDVEDPYDFEVHATAQVACLGLMDATSNLASVRVRVRVDLATQHVQRWLALGEGDCTPPEDVQAGDPAADGTCWGVAQTQAVDPDPAAFPYTFDEEHIRMPAAPRGGAKVQMRGYQVERVSPSGRWLLLTGDYAEKAVTYRRLALLDRSTGKVFPVNGGPWPPPLGASGTKIKLPIKQSQLVPSAADVRWLGAPEREVLLVDQAVIRPEAQGWEITGREVSR